MTAKTTQPMRKVFGAVLFGTVMAALATVASAQDATITASVVGSPSYNVGTSFDVDLAVTANTTVQSNLPVSGGIKVVWPENAVGTSFTLADGDLGTATNTTPVSINGTTPNRTYRSTVTTAGNPSNSSSTPTVFDITFTTVATPPATYDILFSDGTAISRPIALSSDALYDRVYDNTATTVGTTDSSPAAPAEGFLITASVISGDPTVGSAPFTVRVAVSSNTVPTTVIPNSANLRLTFDNTLITPTGISGGDSAGIGPVEGTSPNNTADIFVAYPSNTSLTPDLCQVTFQVVATGTASIDVSADPGVAENFTNVRPQSLAAYPYFETLVTDITEAYVGTSVPAGMSDWNLLND